MKHYGDITKLSGYDLPPVDIITGGSPCQDLSVAGTRTGLKGERSGLFMEQIRIVKEMREATGRDGGTVKPRFMVWENVPGAFTSNEGKDFQSVLTEIVKIAEPNAPDVPMPKKGGWSKSGILYGEMGTWSIAWRIHDAQYWGVPQRRKRISLVADFAGGGAPEILFERKSVPGDSSESTGTGKETAGDVGESFKEPSGCLTKQDAESKPIVFEPGVASRVGGHVYEGVCGTLRADPGDNRSCIAVARHITPKIDEDGVAFTLNSRDYKDPQAVGYSIGAFYSKGMLSDNPNVGIKETDIARTLDLNGGSPTSQQGGIMVLETTKNGIVGTMCARDYKGVGNYDLEKLVIEKSNTFAKQRHGEYKESEVSSTLAQRDYKSATDLVVTKEAITYPGVGITSPVNANNPKPGDPCHTLCSDSRNYVVLENHPNDSRVKICEDNVFQTLSSRMGTGGGNVPMVMQSYVVRRLTPLEYERLQGYPDGWTDIGEWVDSKGKRHKDADTPRYKALGNSIALPFWVWMAERMVAQCGGENITMGSLFDGIGGFPLVFERCGAVPVWASEIEEFCIAVTKKRFGESCNENR